jgi:alpha-D-ribose 1-methylphosphonate 5-triphosphate diphosphatase
VGKLMQETVLTNAEIVLADRVMRGTIQVRDGLIQAIDGGASRVPGAIDCGGDLIMPGLIELHTDNMERHIMPRPGTFWPIDAAVLNHDREIAAAGITTVLDALSLGYAEGGEMRGRLIENFVPALDRHVAADALKADHLLHLRCEVSSENLLRQLDNLIGHPAVRLLSVMDHTPGQRQFVDFEKFKSYYIGKWGMKEDEFTAFVERRMESSRRHGEVNRRATVERALARGIKVASHDDATLPHVEEARRDGIAIAEFPTTLEAAAACHAAGMAVLMGGPNIVRGGSHSGNVAARDLAERGQLDIVSSDYVPSSLLHGALLLEEQIEAMTLPQAIATVTLNPARAVGLDDRGEIAAGKRADLIRVQRAGPVPVIRDVWRGGRKIA